MKKLWIFIIVAIAIIMFYFFALSAFSLEKTADRSYSEIPISDESKEEIAYCLEHFYELSPIEISLSITGSMLEFSEKNDIMNGKANCVGYAQLFTSICNYTLKAGGYEGRAKPVVGSIMWCGINICKVLKAIVPKKYENFVKDHDFIELEYDDKHVYIDPTLFDFCGRTGWTDCPKK